MIENDSCKENPESDKLRPESIKGAFELKNIDLIYPNQKLALKSISLKLDSGKTTAFVGLSGAGKSSAMNLLAGFYDPSKGQVLLDGEPLNQYNPQWVRKHVSEGGLYRDIIDSNARSMKLGRLAATVLG